MQAARALGDQTKSPQQITAIEPGRWAQTYQEGGKRQAVPLCAYGCIGTDAYALVATRGSYGWLAFEV